MSDPSLACWPITRWFALRMKDLLASLSRNTLMGVTTGVVVTGISNSLTLVPPPLPQTVSSRSGTF